MISRQKREKLIEAGYTVSESGTNVHSANGNVVAGINEKGNIFSGSSKVYEILKSKDIPEFTSRRNNSQSPRKASESGPTEASRSSSASTLRDGKKAARTASLRLPEDIQESGGPKTRPRLISRRPSEQVKETEQLNKTPEVTLSNKRAYKKEQTPRTSTRVFPGSPDKPEVKVEKTLEVLGEKVKGRRGDRKRKREGLLKRRID